MNQVVHDFNSSHDAEEDVRHEHDIEESQTSSDNNTLQMGHSSTNQVSCKGSESTLMGTETGQGESTSLRNYIRHESTRLIDQLSPEDKAKNGIIQVDEERLQRAVKDAGEYAYGISAVEVWVMDECSGQLVQHAWWSEEIEDNDNISLKRLNDTSDPDYVDKVIPGVDIAGVLFAESRISQHDTVIKPPTTKTKTFQERMSKSFDPRLLSRSFDPRKAISLFGGNPTNRDNTKLEGEYQDGVQFRDIRSLLLDPDTPKTARLALLNEAGFSKAAGVPFHSGWHNGIVIFYSSMIRADDMLVSIANLVYLRRATDLIGAVVASSEARRAAHALCLSKDCFPKSGHTSAVEESEDGRDELMQHGPKSRTCNERCPEKAVKHTRRWLRKCLGGATSQIPPAMSWNQSLWTLFGSLGGLFLLLGANEVILRSTDDKYFFLLGPIGALATLQYGLTSAPASQPRNVILGQALSGIIVLPLTYIPEDILPIWMRQTLATAFVISSMAKMGVIHPPAGASAMLLASGNFGWEHYGLIVAASILSIFPCILINNLSSKRQYPTYWGYLIRYYTSNRA
mmetsp:Transcript_31548/g.46558  ORF Transcript_31548/g.46558 Transcript_31548/m.46558 type:complete len:570 (-) Transcript_31548:1807-3516(-)